jgi:hypothetical protein
MATPGKGRADGIIAYVDRLGYLRCCACASENIDGVPVRAAYFGERCDVCGNPTPVPKWWTRCAEGEAP